MGLDFAPVTDQIKIANALRELLQLPDSPSAGNVINFDLGNIGLDLTDVPLDEILDFRQQHHDEFISYIYEVRKFVYELSSLSPVEHFIALQKRKIELRENARKIRATTKRAWRRSTMFSLGMVGAAWRVMAGDPVGALLGIGGAIYSAADSPKAETGAYTYILRAKKHTW